MNKTPRTDAQLKLEAFFDGVGIVETVEVEFAQQLEEELIEARAKADLVFEALKKACGGCPRASKCELIVSVYPIWQAEEGK